MSLLVVWIFGGFLPESGPGNQDVISDTPAAFGLGFLTLFAGAVAGAAAMGYYEIGEALIFAMVVGFSAATVTAIAELVDQRLGGSRQSRS